MTSAKEQSGDAFAPGPRDRTDEGEPLQLVHLLMSISRSTRALSGLLLAEIDLEVGQDQLLHVLDCETPLTVSEAASVLNVRPSTISKMCDRLVGRDLLTRSSHGGDARRTLLCLTRDGLAKKSEVEALWARLDGSLNDSEIDGRTAIALSSIDAILRKRLARLR